MALATWLASRQLILYDVGVMNASMADVHRSKMGASINSVHLISAITGGKLAVLFNIRLAGVRLHAGA